ncbi:MAG: class I SAM-dependent methyltransferase [Candidatus Paceibacterota bacterium]
MSASIILKTETSADYELIDSGEGEKLERFGAVILSRPDPQALWRKRLPEVEWKKAHGTFVREEKKGDWSLGKDVLERWGIELSGLKFWIRPTAFKHVGLFPEQAQNWLWLEKKIEAAKTSSEEIEILNLFGYTGGATLACAAVGAKVVHVDGSKVALTWARDNAELSGLREKPVRWILDDAREFVRREIKRDRKYAGIVMDPPAFGHGPEGELWKIEEDFLPLVDDCMKILSDKPLFFLINGYSAGYSAIAYENNLLALETKYGGRIEKGDLVIKESVQEGVEARLLPSGIFARWCA